MLQAYEILPNLFIMELSPVFKSKKFIKMLKVEISATTTQLLQNKKIKSK